MKAIDMSKEIKVSNEKNGVFSVFFTFPTRRKLIDLAKCPAFYRKSRSQQRNFAVQISLDI